MTRSHRLLATSITFALALGSLGACSSDSDDEGSADSSSTSTTAAPESTETEPVDDTEPATGTCTTADTGPLRIVLVNDDGVINPAIDVLIERFQDGDIDMDVTVVAPAEERSGSSDNTTEGGATFTESTTPAGHRAYSVDGYPADSVLVALDELGLEPHLIVSGINPGHNFGTFAALSGTVGVGRTAVRRGVPALAVSAGLQLDEDQFGVGADLAVDWITENCEALLGGDAQTDTVTSINVPACAPDQMGPLQEVPRATEMPEIPEGDNIFASSCDLADPAPADDVTAVRSGYPSITQVEPDL